MKPPSLTLGIEEEYQIIDPETRELAVVHHRDAARAITSRSEQVKPELHQSIVEVGTEVCQTPAEARAELVRLRGLVIELAAKNGLVIAAAGTHPFSSWMEQEITPLERYIGVKEDMGDLAQQLLIFGTHVHVGIEDRDFLIDAMNVAALLRAARARAVDELAVLDGPQHRPEVVPQRRLPQLPAHRHRRRSSDRGTSIESLLDTLVRTGCVPDGIENLVGRAAESQLPDARIPHLRCLHAGRRGGLHRRDLPGDRRQALEAAPRQHDLPRLPGGADRGEQVARRALRHRRQADRLRQASRSCRRATSSRELIEWFLDDVLDELGSRKEVEYAFKILEEGHQRRPAARDLPSAPAT